MSVLGFEVGNDILLEEVGGEEEIRGKTHHIPHGQKEITRLQAYAYTSQDNRTRNQVVTLDEELEDRSSAPSSFSMDMLPVSPRNVSLFGGNVPTTRLEKAALSTCEVVGQADRKYLIVRMGNLLVAADQHAAKDERLHGAGAELQAAEEGREAAQAGHGLRRGQVP